MSTYNTPAVTAVAQRHGVDLSTVKGTGAGGRITVADVNAAAARRRTPGAAPRLAAVNLAATSAGRASVRVVATVPWDATAEAEIDVFGANPLLELIRATNPLVLKMAQAEGPAPTLFASGDLPVFIAAGADPTLLRQLPWIARHAAAAADQAELARMLEQYPPTLAGWDNALMDGLRTEAGTADYVRRMASWLSGITVNGAQGF